MIIMEAYFRYVPEPILEKEAQIFSSEAPKEVQIRQRLWTYKDQSALLTAKCVSSGQNLISLYGQIQTLHFYQ